VSDKELAGGRNQPNFRRPATGREGGKGEKVRKKRQLYERCLIREAKKEKMSKERRRKEENAAPE